jgi:hypothetical protein
LGRDQSVAPGNHPHGGDQILGDDVLQEEAARPGAQGVVDVLIEIEGRQHQHGGLTAALGDDPARGLQPVEIRHLDVHQHDARPPRARQVDRIAPVGSLADYGDAGLRLEDRAEAGAHEGLVVGDEH